MRRLLGALRRADDRFKMIKKGDKIAVGLSGGKDSMAMLYALTLYRLFSKKEYELIAICVDLGFESYNVEVIQQYCDRLEIPLTVVKTQIAQIVFDIRKEKNPCALCAKMRKGALYERAVGMGCNKAAFAHHAGDVTETLLMSMMYEARLNTFSPKTYLSRRDITLIRPLILAAEADIKSTVAANDIPIAKNPCPIDFSTKREQTKELLRHLDTLGSRSSDHIFKAISNPDTYNLWNKDFDW